MKLERILISVVWLLLLSGLVAWAVGGVQQLHDVSVWLWAVGLGVLSLPLLLWFVELLARRRRH